MVLFIYFIKSGGLCWDDIRYNHGVFVRAYSGMKRIYTEDYDTKKEWKNIGSVKHRIFFFVFISQKTKTENMKTTKKKI